MVDLRLIPLSALQHYAFCPRQCALIHNEQMWSDNFLTAQGMVLHERVDSGEPESRKGVRYERGVLVAAPSLGLIGKLDLVECVVATGELFPVEYKRGKPKPSDWDELQLCAQALCLEEMTGSSVTQGALWYHRTRHRHPVQFSTQLREHTLEVISLVRKMLESGGTPKAQYGKHCKACSLIDLCQSLLTAKDQSLTYQQRLFRTDTVDEETSE